MEDMDLGIEDKLNEANNLFVEEDFAGALKIFNNAIQLCSSGVSVNSGVVSSLFSNRAACSMKLGIFVGELELMAHY